MKGSGEGRAAFSVRAAEIAVALAIFAVGAVIALDSVRIGARWTEEGPQTGYFPFFVGLVVCAASAINLVRALLMQRERASAFVQVGQLKLVLAVLAPAAVFVGIVPWTGIYLAATLFIAYFMRRLGRYPWWKAASGALATGIALFLLFEIWFLVPLPKGPLERLLGVG